MGDVRVLAQSERHVLFEADTGSLRFTVLFPDRNMAPSLTLHSKLIPQKELYKITLGRIIRIKNRSEESNNETTFISEFNHTEPISYWLTWHGGKIKMGLQNQTKPLITHKMNSSELIGYVQYDTLWRNYSVEWTVELSPVRINTVPIKIFDEDLIWVRMVDNQLPIDAVIGGFENEPIYVARAHCNNSLSPGKYVPSTGMAYLPWGHREISTRDFEILCGVNALWVETSFNSIPLDAFIAGYSEVRQEPLYIGRAMHEGNLLIGKVHTLYKTCYLPYKGREVEVTKYEILTVPKVNRAVGACRLMND